MEIRLDIGITQLIGLIKQLPVDQKLKIKREVDKELSSSMLIEEENELTDLLLSGPIMTKDEEINFKKFNKAFDKWTKSLSA